MNIKVPHSWLKESLNSKATPEEIEKNLSLCGPSVERTEKHGDDSIFDIEITTNRIDTVSIEGIARECSAILPQFGIDAELTLKSAKTLNTVSSIEGLTIEDPDCLVHRVMACVIENVAVQPSTPIVAQRLEMCDTRPINSIVDITNYVMLETGFPIHAFDLDKIKTNTLRFRKAQTGEKFKALDGKEYTLSDEDVVIDDGTGRIIDLPGIMGAENTEISPETTCVLFFTEHNNAKSIRRTSMRLGIRTMAASINEKRPDYHLMDRVMAKAISMAEEYGGKASEKVIELNTNTSADNDVIEISAEKINKLIGVEILQESVVRILSALEFGVEAKENSFIITVPTFRQSDIQIPEDIVEEVARIYGYHTIPSVVQTTDVIDQPQEIAMQNSIELKLKYLLKHLGLHEDYVYSMISATTIEKMADKVDGGEDSYLHVLNPISTEIEYMRRSLIPSHVATIAQNQGKKDTFGLFEIANVYNRQVSEINDLPQQLRKLCIVGTMTFFELKGILELIFKELNISATFEKTSDHTYFVSGSQAVIRTQSGDEIGAIGVITNQIQNNFRINSQISACELDMSTLVSHYQLIPTYQPINQFGTVKLDLSIEKKGRPYSKIYEMVRSTSPLITNCELVEMHDDKLLLRIYFSSKEKNLTLEEAKEVLALIE